MDIVKALSPIVYADQKKKKVFVIAQDEQSIYNPDELSFEDGKGQSLSIPKSIKGHMTVLDVQGVSAGGYFLRFLGAADRAIKVILF